MLFKGKEVRLARPLRLVSDGKGLNRDNKIKLCSLTQSFDKTLLKVCTVETVNRPSCRRSWNLGFWQRCLSWGGKSMKAGCHEMSGCLASASWEFWIGSLVPDQLHWLAGGCRSCLASTHPGSRGSTAGFSHCSSPEPEPQQPQLWLSWNQMWPLSSLSRAGASRPGPSTLGFLFWCAFFKHWALRDEHWLPFRLY